MDAYGKRRLIERVRRTLRLRHYSRRTKKAYCYWIRMFIGSKENMRQATMLRLALRSLN